jgi:hypothetical protein
MEMSEYDQSDFSAMQFGGRELTNDNPYLVVLEHMPIIAPVIYFLIYKTSTSTDKACIFIKDWIFPVIGLMLQLNTFANFGIYSMYNLQQSYSVQYKFLQLMNSFYSITLMVSRVNPKLALCSSLPSAILFYLSGINGNPDHETVHYYRPLIVFVFIVIHKTTNLFNKISILHSSLLVIMLTVWLIFESVLWSHGICSAYGCAINTILANIFNFLRLNSLFRMSFSANFWSTLPIKALKIGQVYGPQFSITRHGLSILNNHYLRVFGLTSRVLSQDQITLLREGRNVFSEYYAKLNAIPLIHQARTDINLRPLMPVSCNVFESGIKFILIIIRFGISIILYTFTKKQINPVAIDVLNNLNIGMTLSTIIAMMPSRYIGHGTFLFTTSAVIFLYTFGSKIFLDKR